ncbi:hypothetical protein BKA66DRAFT_427846 [Pyrenochaeta sp. MPI-SDFR-AT-0127]|nr:hypothetical protein BKA66DRAFT_427846 [Pyrenochaeta sp. MPI-SDFR-AT-0127]
MATYHPHSHSPRIQAGNPMTPVHSPHHSVTSSASSRTPIHTLTIHEYRKQQYTPTSQKGTPSGKTLRRKAAASGLSDIERVPSVSRTTRSGSGSSLRPLHFSRSVQQLKSSQSLFPQQTLADLSFRSQSAEPRVQGGSVSSISTANLSGKVCHFNSRKRLPRPPVPGPILFLPLANVKSTQVQQSPLPATLSFCTEASHSSDAQTTPALSTFSLSRFPQPPDSADPAFSPPRDEREDTHVNAVSFTTTAPATPPATPAIIHYRGTSFDLVNPHNSLLLHDIVTPSKDFDSSDFLPLRSSDEPEDSLEMAPKRALYGDFGSAHASIMRRAEDSFTESNLDLPLPPTPAAVSPNSSAYTSPLYSPGSIRAPSPLIIKKPVNDARFSLKQLTRNLSKKLGKSPSRIHDEQQELRDINVNIALASTDGNYPRPLTQTYVATPEASYFPVSPASPVTPTSPASPFAFGPYSPEDHGVELPRKHSSKGYDAEPLVSMLPDDPSTQVGRMDDSQFSMPEHSLLSKPYYDDLDSIYPSSSVYTGDDRRKSNYQQSLTSNRQSNPFTRSSGMDASSFASEYNRDGLYGYGSTRRSGHQTTRSRTEELLHRSLQQKDANTDTISKFIDQYQPDDTVDIARPPHTEQPANLHRTTGMGSNEESKIHRPQAARVTSGLSQFEFGLRPDIQHGYDYEGTNTIQPVLARKSTMTRGIGSPPRGMAPLAPAFEYDEAPFITPRPELSDMFSNESSYSYGDTRNLLRIPQSDPSIAQNSGEGLQPSSSYSQPEAKELMPSSMYSQADSPASPQTPQEALDQAEQIFQDVRMAQQSRNDGIPAMWARRSSGSLLLSKKPTKQFSGDEDKPEYNTVAIEEDKTDWETLGRNSPEYRTSLDSIADYSSSDGARNSLGLNSDGSLPSWANQSHSQGFSQYGYSSPLRSHPNPFNSSPPKLEPRASRRISLENPSAPLASVLPVSTTAHVDQFSTRPEYVPRRVTAEEAHAFTPWSDPYALTDKETQELLASGPNDSIIIDNEANQANHPNRVIYQHSEREMAPDSLTSKIVFGDPAGLERENTFEKLTVIGSKGNLTGTPHGTGMHETGSSVADTSSPGLRLSSSVGRRSMRSDYPGFYASPFPATGSVTPIQSSGPPQNDLEHERTPSQITLFPGANSRESAQEKSTPSGHNKRQSLRCSTTFDRAQRRNSRAAVPGQTKLRQMVLSPEGRATMSSQDTHFSRFINGSERPSTSDTNTPLRPSHNLSIDTFPVVARGVIAHEHSPHLLCPEREASAEDEASRRKLSWVILAAFCLIPPCILLHRVWGDWIITSLTEGRLGHCTAQSKRVALIAGIVVNIGIVTAILVPILVAHALKAL